ncbi:hypothetical protein HAZT_HAZT010191 [Hyalella azteca]|uniref:Ig-like domain-containing protein n=1 Tax=Hyalella azteca TaxID=294128 RepID=A0A6A0HFV6_HYAAZ|nr:hypothetical protein HAZT_HAZT010191 [Hyalella azteca]
MLVSLRIDASSVMDYPGGRFDYDICCLPSLKLLQLGEEFLQVPQNTRVGEGEVAMLECQPPPGSPPPVVTWSKDGRPLDPAVNHRLV